MFMGRLRMLSWIKCYLVVSAVSHRWIGIIAYPQINVKGICENFLRIWLISAITSFVIFHKWLSCAVKQNYFFCLFVHVVSDEQGGKKNNLYFTVTIIAYMNIKVKCFLDRSLIICLE